MRSRGRRELALLVGAVTTLSLTCARGDPNVYVSSENESPAGQQAAANLVGDWLLRADPPLPPDGLRITVTLDSTVASDVFGRISHFFSGNVGSDPRAYVPFVGALTDGGTIEFTVRHREPTQPGLSVFGRVAGDTVRCDRLVLGPDTLTGGSRSWLFVKEGRRGRL